ncbi:MAG TPA: o-succinylbenzoate--CoA ligase [Nocardioidaceae bacterium]|nr:o-succinylbenzoate--CoA ligase [Nocardioidaceae bacterium]
MSSLRPVTGGPAEVLAMLREWNSLPEEPEPLVIETSGSTGRPKRVVLSRTALRASASATLERIGGPGQWLLNLPATYVAGVQVLFRSVLAGSEPVLLDEHPDFSTAAAAMSGSRRYVSLVPTQVHRMLRTPVDLQALRAFDVVLVGGAAVGEELRAAAGRAGIRIVATYGMSETCGGCVYDGVPLDGVALAVGTDGQIRIGGPTLFSGYEDDLALTDQVMDGGWFLTSDFGRLDEDGRLQVLGRMDDVVVSGGVNVPAQAVAERLRTHPSIETAEVVGVFDAEWGQRVVAVVVSPAGLETRRMPGLEDVRNWVSQVHPRIWAPRQLVRLDEIPLLPNGKVDRRELERLARRDPADRKQPRPRRQADG